MFCTCNAVGDGGRFFAYSFLYRRRLLIVTRFARNSPPFCVLCSVCGSLTFLRISNSYMFCNCNAGADGRRFFVTANVFCDGGRFFACSFLHRRRLVTRFVRN